jgi:hypothetical protein
MKWPWRRATPTQQPAPGTGPGGTDAKRWAQRADQLPFTQLADIRATASNWRTGLTGLTSLLSVTSIVVAPNLADKLDGAWRIAAGGLVVAGLLALLYGTWQAMAAAFGIPGEARPLSGQMLWAWETQQASSGAAALRRARKATLAGLALIIATTAVVVVGATRARVPGPLVRLDTSHGSFCGHLSTGPRPATLGVVGDDGTVHIVNLADLQVAQPVSNC